MNSLSNITETSGMNSNTLLMQSEGGALESQDGIVPLSMFVDGYNSASSSHDRRHVSVVSPQLAQLPSTASLITGNHVCLGSASSLSMIHSVNPSVSSKAPHQNILEHPSLSNQSANLQDCDLRMNCFDKEGHNRKMEKPGFGPDYDASTCDRNETNPHDSRILSSQRCVKYLVHACQCRDANCRLPSCPKMKKLLQRAKRCKRKANGDCNICKQLEMLCSYHASHCQNFDLCVKCFDKDDHNHKMEELGFGPEYDASTCDRNETSPQESRILLIQHCVKYLVHASQCRDTDCKLPNCPKMKRVVQHAKSCKETTNGGCHICKQLIALCCHHAKKCQEANCPVPFCVNMKQKLRQQLLQKRLQQAQILKRRIAVMQNRGMSGTVPQTSPGNSDTSSHLSHINSAMEPAQVSNA